MFSILILTYNEEANIAACLDSVSFSNDIWILDSRSTDDTVQIAENKGAYVRFRNFDNYAAQRNFGLSLPFKNNWILMLDADELLTPELQDEIMVQLEQENNPVTLYRMRRKDMFMSRWIKRSSGYPTWFGRLFRKGTVHVEREINEEYMTTGEVGLLEGHLLHYPFNKGIDHWFTKHNQYSTMEAKRLMHEISYEPVPWKLFFSQDPMLRRRAFKRIAYRVPARPLMTFIYLYVLRLGFIDGLAGLYFCLLRSIYELMINLKIWESSKK